MSLPTRERGLKPQIHNRDIYGIRVAPYAGAWIETEPSGESYLPDQSLPTRERGLKHATKILFVLLLRSLPTRERGLKRLLAMQLFSVPLRRSLRGSVD